MIAPIKTKPVFKQYIWGGSALADKYGKKIKDNFAAESWEISCHNDGLSLIAEGEYAGKTLKEVVMGDKLNMIGYETDEFPLLVKILDANKNLSVQVHPNDDFAREHENGSLGKTEMWYVIDAKPGAKLVYGVKDGVTKEMLKNSLRDGTAENLLNYVPAKKGDAFFIPSGTLHAICSGLLIAEIQQSSNTTYRVYDYNRTDANGNKRPLHIEKALEVINFESSCGKEKFVPKQIECVGANAAVISECEFFTVIKYEIDGMVKIEPMHKSFELLICTEGNAELIFNGGKMYIAPGDSVFVPAALGKYDIEGSAQILRSYVPVSE